MPFRSDINGLRAIAVIMVVYFHFFPQVMPGGFVGVDVFFVISGFLMTKIILSGASTSNSAYFRSLFLRSLLAFYRARIKRIIPALAWMCLALLAWGYWQFTPALLHEVSKHALSSVLFVSNFTYLFETGYFDAAAQDKWLLHTWSLSVEWQFYLLYPLVLMGLAQIFSLAWLKRFILLAAVLSFALCICLGLYSAGFFTTSHPSASANPFLSSANYYLLPTRAWEMLLGGLAFCYGASGISGFKLSQLKLSQLKLSQKAKTIIANSALIIIIACGWLVSEQTPWPSIWSLLPTVCTYLVIVCHVEQPILNNKPMQAIGLWSYSIYLWHWPLMVAGNFYQLPYWWLLGPLCSVVLGWLSFTVIEKPKRPSLNITVFVAVVLLSAWPLVNKWQQNSANQVAHLSYSSTICTGFEDFCRAFVEVNGGRVTSNKNSNQPLDFIIWGDSHSTVLARALALEGYHIAVFTTLGCPPIHGIRRLDGMGGDSGCNSKINDKIYQHLLSPNVQKQAEQILLIGRWSVYHWGWHKNSQLQKANHYLCYQHCDEFNMANATAHLAKEQSLNEWQQGLEQTVKGLTEHYQLTLFKGGPSLKVRGVDFRDADWQQLSLSEHLAYQHATDEVIEKLSKKYHFKTIEHGRWWFKAGKMQMYHNQHLLFNDDNHPTLRAWQMIMKPLTQQLRQND